MKALVIRDFKEERKNFKKGDVLTVKNGSVFLNDLWICDVGSPVFNRNLKIIAEKD